MWADRTPRAPSKKPCRFFQMNDCFRGDKCHMVHARKEEMDPCQTHNFWLEDPWTRPPCQWGDRCSRPHPAHTGPADPDLLRTNIALQTENSQIARVRAYASEVLGARGEASDTGLARSGTSRYKQKLALLEARDPEQFSRTCVADPSLCRSLLRVYILGGGVCSSLEDVGRALAADVASGKYAISNSPTVATAAPGIVTPSPTATNTTGAESLQLRDVPEALPLEERAGTGGNPPLLVRVQALPKAMELQLIDEDSTFWGDTFPGLVRERQAGLFTHVLSIVFVRGAYLYGLSEAATHGRAIIENNNEASPVCRAFYKIKEVTSRAGIEYGNNWTVIDVGAAPGGWTSYLSPRCRRVLSVDPAELDPAVLALPNVVHVQQMIGAAHATLRDLLQAAGTPSTTPEENCGEIDQSCSSGICNGSCCCGNSGSGNGSNAACNETCSGAGVSGNGVSRDVDDSARVVATGGEGAGGADLLVSDMNAEPEVVAGVLLSSMKAGLVKPGGLVVATFKDFCGRNKRMRDEVAVALARLKAGTASLTGPIAGESGASVRVDVVEDGGGGGHGGRGGDDGGDEDTDTGDCSATRTALSSARAINTSGGSEHDEGGGGKKMKAAHESSTEKMIGGREDKKKAFRGSSSQDGGEDRVVVEGGGVGVNMLKKSEKVWWRMEGIETMKLLAGGQAEVTVVGRAARVVGFLPPASI